MGKKVNVSVKGGLILAKGKRSKSQKLAVKGKNGGLMLHQKMARGQKV